MVELPFSRALLTACIGAFGVLCLVVAGLLGVLMVVTFARADGPAPLQTAFLAFVFVVLGFGSRALAKRFAPR